MLPKAGRSPRADDGRPDRPRHRWLTRLDRVSGCGGGAVLSRHREGRGCDGDRLLANCDEERELPRRREPRRPGWRSGMPWAPPHLFSYVLGKTVFDSFRTRTSGAPALKRWSAQGAWDTSRRQPTSACNRPHVRHGTGCSPRTTLKQSITRTTSVFDDSLWCANGSVSGAASAPGLVKRALTLLQVRLGRRYPTWGRRRHGGRR